MVSAKINIDGKTFSSDMKEAIFQIRIAPIQIGKLH